MMLGRVMGAVWATRKAEALAGSKLLRVEPLDGGADDELVAVDHLSAGPGDIVLVACSSRVRDLTVGADIPTKAVVIAIVDDMAVAAE